MKLTDRKIIEFLSKSPIQDFEAIRDTLRYLDGNWIWEDIEYELFHEALGDNPEVKISIRVPDIKHIPGNALLHLTWHAEKFDLVRKRVPKMKKFPGEPDELVVFYKLTPKGKEVLKLLEAIVQAKEEVGT